MQAEEVFIHPTSVVEDPSAVGAGTRIWYFCHLMRGARVGRACNIGQNVFVDSGAVIGDGVKIQNNVSIYAGVVLEDYVFCGPSCVFTNVINPRSEVPRPDEFRRTLVRRGATIGANATVVAGTTIGRYAFIAAGAVVVRGEVPDYALMMGAPAVRRGWMSRHGHRLVARNAEGDYICSQSKWRYRLQDGDRLRCLDWSEDEALPRPTGAPDGPRW
ncbi:MAG: N-acetyltransferase [Nitrospirae bacterium]|nr:N-acetyltransferase [Nitrospirota bacterium]